MTKSTRTSKFKGPRRGDFVRAQGGWWHVNLDTWGNGVTYLATPMSGPYFPGRQALGPPQIVNLEKYDELISQHDLVGPLAEGDPLKGSGR